MPCLLRKEGRGGRCRPARFFRRARGPRPAAGAGPGPALLLAASLLALAAPWAGCAFNVSDVGESLGGRTLPAGQPHPELWADPERWVLIENPRYQPEDPAGRQEPQYVWAERDRLPLTFNRAIGGTRAVLAPPDVQARYASDKVPPPQRP